MNWYRTFLYKKVPDFFFQTKVPWSSELMYQKMEEKQIHARGSPKDAREFERRK